MGFLSVVQESHESINRMFDRHEAILDASKRLSNENPVKPRERGPTNG
jgi:hypothetical protein